MSSEQKNRKLQNSILSTKALVKKYGPITAVDHLNLEVPANSIFGILGPNGSGKTTTLGIVVDVIRQNSGSYTWFGKDPGHELRQQIGTIIENPYYYPYLTATQNLRIIADIKGTSTQEIEEVLKITGLYERRNSKFRTYSLGMKQRLAIAGALLGHPKVLILDEPTNGLDPKGIAEIRQLILDIAERGISIILASHLLDEVQKVCTHVAVLSKGKLLDSGSVERVLAGAKLIEVSSDNLTALNMAVQNFPWIRNAQQENNLFILQVSDDTTPELINKAFYEKGIILNHLNERKSSLENYFLKILKESE